MKTNRFAIAVFATVALVGVAFGAMESRDFEFNSLKLDPATGTVSYVIRGELLGVKVDIGGTTTNAIQISEANLGAIVTLTNLADGVYFPRALINGNSPHATTGLPYTQAWTQFGIATNGANVDRIPLAGLVTVRWIQHGLATNDHKVTLIYNK